ncbi:MAG: sigma-70 family RNA polymerase sigma factor [Anaerolineales bacterium]|nr:sigma-70 family RNA polymerase sigma factor [Anaerolineales bacterium]
MIEVADLLTRAKAGDEDAFVELYEQHRSAVFTYIYYRVADQATAEELMAEVFVRMVEGAHRYKAQGKPVLAWLYTIARNLVIDHHRKTSRYQEVPIDSQLPAEAVGPEGVIEGALNADCLQRALEHLTEDQRLVILLKFVDRRSNAETAAILGKSEGAVKSLQHRALGALKRVIAREGCYEP